MYVKYSATHVRRILYVIDDVIIPYIRLHNRHRISIKVQ